MYLAHHHLELSSFEAAPDPRFLLDPALDNWTPAKVWLNH